MDVILFTDITNHPIPVKTIGAYKIANVLRKNGYNTIVINDLNYIIQNRLDDLFDFLDEKVSENTLYFGISTTFLSVIKDNHGNTLVSQTGNAPLWVKHSYKKPYDYRHDEIESNFKLYPNFLKFINKLRSYNKKIVIGGSNHTSYLLNNLLKPDHWIQGLAETAIIQFTKDLRSGKQIPQLYSYDKFAALYDFHNSHGTFIEDDIVLENETLPIEFSRGCRFKCKFCSYPLLGRNTKDTRYIKSEEAIYRELKHNYDTFGTKNYFFLCDTFNETTEKLKTVKTAIDRIGIDCKFFSYLRIELLHKNPDQISILRDMGIGGAHFGIESLNYDSAKSIGKGLKTDLVLKTIDKCREAWGRDVVTMGSFIIGLPHDTPSTCDEWTKIITNGEIGLTSVSFKPLSMDMNTNEDDKIFYSEFERNMGKYGYEKHGDNWKNEHWTFDEACKYAEYINSQWWATKKYGISPFNAMMYLTADYMWDEITSARKGDIMFEKIRDESYIRGNEKRNEYFDRMLSSF